MHPHRRVSVVATILNKKVVVSVRERKWPELKLYITNEYSDASAARAVMYLWYMGFMKLSISVGEMRPVKIGTV